MTAPLSLSPLACRLIAFYQRHASPRKGFRCAYRVHTGRTSCSQFAKRAIDRVGVLTGGLLLRRRFRRCHLASRQLAYDPRAPEAKGKTGVNGWTAQSQSCAGDPVTECLVSGGLDLAGDACCAACSH
jgi:putative component of membrane protein insertase Oxa1/YidC/SpoIIIJ protein YidD